MNSEKVLNFEGISYFFPVTRQKTVENTKEFIKTILEELEKEDRKKRLNLKF